MNRKEFFEKYTPTWAKAYILAEYQVNECDAMTDYYHAGVKRRIFLGFSKHTRNNAQELIKFAHLLDETKELVTMHRIEKYYGYKLMSPEMSVWSTGWIVRKVKDIDYENLNWEYYFYNILPTLK